MPKLTLNAIGEDTIASPGNASNLYIIVSVEDLNGEAVSGLAIGNFALGSEIVRPGGSISHINTVSNVNYPAFTCFRSFRSQDKPGRPGFTFSQWRLVTAPITGSLSAVS